MTLRRPKFRRAMLRLNGVSRDAVPTWRRRILFLIGGICVGLAAVAMAKLADAASILFRGLVDRAPLVALVLTPAGFAAAAVMARSVFPNSQGSGIPQVIAARALDAGPARDALVSLRVAGGKVAVMTLGLLCGASIGREGPTVQVGAAIMASIGRFSPDRMRGLVLAGGAAGVAAAFNTPLAGIVFGIEELGRAYDSKASALIIGAIIAAGLTSLAVLGDYTYFGTTDARLATSIGWVIVPVLGVAGGLAGGLFSRVVIAVLCAPSGLFGRLVRRRVAFAAACGLGVALCGLASGGTIYGTGYDEARAMLHGEHALHYEFAPLKFAATLLSAISGIPGGLFAPSLSVGAGLGHAVQALFPDVPVGVLVLTGMVAYLAGVLQAPITSFVIVTEMTQNHAMMIPLMITAVLADAASKLLCREGLYHALARALVERTEASRENVRGDGT